MDQSRGVREVYNHELASIFEEAFNEQGFIHRANGRIKVASTCGLCSASRKKSKDKCAYVFYDIGAYTCNHCKESGVIPLKEGVRLNKVKRVIEAPTPKTYRKPESLPGDVRNEALLKFLEQRGLTEETLNHLGIITTSIWTPGGEGNRPAIAFPYYRDGELINVKYRGPEKSFRLEKDAELIPYNVDALSLDSPYVIWTEGEMDAASWVEVGEKAVISSPNGSSVNLSWFSPEDAEKIKGKIILISGDEDEAGKVMIEAIKARFSATNVVKVISNLPHKDANKVLQEEGAASLIKRKQDALDKEVKGLVKAENYRERVINYAKGEGVPPGDNIEIPEFDAHLTFKRGETTFITGKPGDGKSTFLDFIISRLAYLHDWRVLILSVEKPDVGVHVTELIEKISRVNTTQMSSQELSNWLDWIEAHFIFIDLDEQELISTDIFEKVYEVNASHDIDGFVLDNIATLEDSGEDRNDVLNRIVSKITYMSKKCNLHSFVVAHPRKLTTITGQVKPAKGYDIAGTSNVYNKTDNGITVYRDEVKGEVMIDIWKVRWWYVGTTGKVYFNWVKNIRSYEIVPHDVSTRRNMGSKNLADLIQA